MSQASRDRAAAISFELAAAVANLLLLRVMTRPREPADQVAAIVSEVAIYGIARKA